MNQDNSFVVRHHLVDPARPESWLQDARDDAPLTPGSSTQWAMTPPRQFTFEGSDVFFVEVQGRPATTVNCAAAALGYESADRIRDLMQKRQEDFLEGMDYLVIEGDALAAFKLMAPTLLGERAPALMLLHESALHLLAMFSRKARARAFRRWLVSEVLPSIARTGSYSLRPSETVDLVPVQQRLDGMADQLRELQGTLDALLPIGDRFGVADALGLIFERWYTWKANVPVTPAALCAWALPQADVRNAFERVLPDSPGAATPLNPTALKRWLTNAVGMEVSVRLAPRVTRVELRMSGGPAFWLRS